MATHGAPPFNLTVIVRAAATDVIPTVPLKPTAGVLFIDPSLPLPFRQRLRCIYAEEVQVGIVSLGAQLGIFVPVRRKLLAAVSHVFSAKHAKFEHFLRGKFGLEVGVKVLSARLSEYVAVAGLHEIVDLDLLFCHALGGCRIMMDGAVTAHTRIKS